MAVCGIYIKIEEYMPGKHLKVGYWRNIGSGDFMGPPPSPFIQKEGKRNATTQTIQSGSCNNYYTAVDCMLLLNYACLSHTIILHDLCAVAHVDFVHTG